MIPRTTSALRKRTRKICLDARHLSKPIAIIPARGGSQRIPGKNIREFCGKPMIGWSIAAALESALFEEVVVTTDSEEIAEVARAAGASVPFTRPPELANNFATTIPVVRHAITALEEQSSVAKLYCCLYATAPFATPDMLREGEALLRGRPEMKFAFTVTSFPAPIHRAFEVASDGSLQMFWPENEAKRSQDLPEGYHDAGLFYWGTKEAFLTEDSVFASHSLPLIIPRHRVQDIDTEEDWHRAEHLFKVLL